MKTLPFLPTTLAVVITCAVSAKAGEMGHFFPAVYGTRDFFQPAEPGFYFAQPNFVTLSDEFHTGNGDAFDSLTISRSIDLTRTWTGSRAFSFTKTGGSSVVLNYEGSHLDLAAQIDRATQVVAGVTLTAQAQARLQAEALVNAHLDDLDLSIAGFSPTLIWKSYKKFLGATIGAYAAMPIVNMDIDARVSGTVDVRARVDARITVNAVATVTGTATGIGTLTATAADGSSITTTKGKSVSKTITRSKTVTAGYDASLDTRFKFTKRIKESVLAQGDLYVQPLWLDWSREHYQVSLSDGFYAPIGHYSPGAIDNIGFGFWTNQTQLAAAWYPWKSRGTAFTVATTYEVHGNKEGEDIRPGDNFTVNWGVSQILPLNKKQTVLADIGFGGYDLFQVSDDSGRDVTWDASVHDEVHAFGPQLGLVFPKWNAGLSLRWMHEYAARDHFQSDTISLKFAKKF